MPRVRGNDVSLESIISGQRCTPLSAPEFERWLKHRDFSLEFVLWLRRYRKRFDALPAADRARSPAPPTLAPVRSQIPPSERSATGISAFLSALRPTLGRADTSAVSSKTGVSSDSPTLGQSGTDDGELPFVREVAGVWAHFLKPGAAAELNISCDQYSRVREALGISPDGMPTRTTHPEAFDEVYAAIWQLMESDSLPKFIKFAASNINSSKTRFWYSVGAADFGVGLAVCLVTLFFAHSRWFRIIGLPFILFGSMQIYSASLHVCETSFERSLTVKFCTQVWGRDARQLYPWELADSALAPAASTTSAFASGTLSSEKRPSFDSIEPSTPITAKPLIPARHSSRTADSIVFTCPWGEERSAPGLAIPAELLPEYDGKRRGSMGRRATLGAVGIPTFGPETQILDAAILALQQRYITRILWSGAISTVVMAAVFLPLPTLR